MKKIFYILALVATATLASCNQDLLETAPTDEISAETLITDATGAQVAISGIYSYMYQGVASSSWASENLGILARTLAFDLMGEDNYPYGAGSQWYYYDHLLDTDGDFTRSYGRQGQQWFYYYTIIAQANYVIAKEDVLVAEGFAGQDVVAQAYSIRAFAYNALAEWFCQGNYPENKETPGVPLYTTPTSMDTKGQTRGTLADTYAQINADYKAAYDLFKVVAEGGYKKTHVSHIDFYTNCVLWARTALAEGEWQRAYDLATEALAKPGLVRVESVKNMGGLNDSSLGNVLWGFQVVADQTGPYGPFISHMDPYNGGFCGEEKKCFSDELYASIPETDERLAWINTKGFEDEEGELIMKDVPVSIKFLYKDAATSVADQIIVRAEEAILIAAEAACRLKDWTNARTLLTELGTKRDSKYADRLDALQDSDAFNDDTTAALIPQSLMDEVLWQRRVELWGEATGRLYDLKRLNLGYTRSVDGLTTKPGDLRFTILLPQKEFDNNKALNIGEDQNPR